MMNMFRKVKAQYFTMVSMCIIHSFVRKLRMRGSDAETIEPPLVS
jgi:hypothetical protein